MVGTVAQGGGARESSDAAGRSGSRTSGTTASSSGASTSSGGSLFGHFLKGFAELIRHDEVLLVRG
jgi:hypothetical protein